MYRILASILDGRDTHGAPKESAIHSLPCTSSDHNYPEFTGKETETLGGKVTQLGGIQAQSHGHEHRALLQVPGVCTLLLRCLPPAPTMNGTGYGQALCPFTGSQPLPSQVPTGISTLSPDCSQQHSNIFRNYTCQFQTFLPIFCSPWHQNSLKLYCLSPLFLPILP